MDNKLPIIILSIFLLIYFFDMIWYFRKTYREYSESNADSSRLDIIKLSFKDFFNGYPNRNIASIIAALIIFLIMFLGFAFAKTIPQIVLEILCLTSGFIWLRYFIQSVFDTVKSIKKEKFKSVIKVKFKGVLSFFVFLLFLLAYQIAINIK